MTKLVSVRMPKPLVQELRTLVEKNHYLDFSEQLRSVIRQRAQHYLEPQPTQNSNQSRKQQLLKELKELLEVDE
jgi:Arc/MetJ-type ribon-helix-helix transcriptional regulator